MDLYSGKIVGYSFSRNLGYEFVIEAIEMALIHRK